MDERFESLRRSAACAQLNREQISELVAITANLPAPNPTGRVASPEEVAAFVAFLLSDESKFITGSALAIDGGFTAE